MGFWVDTIAPQLNILFGLSFLLLHNVAGTRMLRAVRSGNFQSSI